MKGVGAGGPFGPMAGGSTGSFWATVPGSSWGICHLLFRCSRVGVSLWLAQWAVGPKQLTQGSVHTWTPVLARLGGTSYHGEAGPQLRFTDPLLSPGRSRPPTRRGHPCLTETQL